MCSMLKNCRTVKYMKNFIKLEHASEETRSSANSVYSVTLVPQKIVDFLAESRHLQAVYTSNYEA